MMDKPWEEIDYREVRELYDRRVETHRVLLEWLNAGDVARYVELALGIHDKCGNYSAAEHGHGPKIRLRSTDEQIFALAKKLFVCQSAEEIVETIYRAKLPNLKIGVGSEMSMMLRPDSFWVTNRRTIWSHLVLKYKGDTQKANRDLPSYDPQSGDPELQYPFWRELHPLIGPSLRYLATLGGQVVMARSIEPGDLVYLWADAIANSMYNDFGPG